MPRTIGIGIQDFEKLITSNSFYVDKTGFIKEWWENNDDVTLITRPRRFGKTLTMDMIQRFFSVEYAQKSEIFEGLSIWNEGKYVSAKYSCGFSIFLVSSIIVDEKYLDYFNTITEDRL